MSSYFSNLSLIMTSKFDKSYRRFKEFDSWHIFLIVLFLMLVIFRVVYSTPIEFNDESILKWKIGHRLSSSWEWSILGDSHHEKRWSIILPYVVLSVFTTKYSSYYFFPILFSCIFSIIAVGYFRHVNYPKLVGLLVVTAISFEPISHALSSQVVTGGFGLFYLIVGFLFLIKYLEGKKYSFLLFSVLFFFCSYGSHITYLLFVSGVVSFLLINRRDYFGVASFLGMFFLCILVETTLFSLLEDIESAGRFVDLVSGKTHKPTYAHGTGGGYELSHFLLRWKLVPKYDLLVLGCFLLGSLSLIQKKIRSLS